LGGARPFRLHKFGIIRRSMMRPFTFLSFLLLCPSAHAAVLLTQDQALRLAFPEGEADRRTLYLDETSRAGVQKQARARVESLVITYYVGALADATTGYAFFETHIVRTMPETFMTVIDSSGTVRFVELLAFYEPADYQPPPRWFEQFQGKILDNNLLVKRGIRNITGATLSTHALTDGVRRALALWALIQGGGDPARRRE
jgi:hypothetical protein